MNLLSADRIRENIGGAACSSLESIEVFPEIGSTNSYLLNQPGPGVDNYRVALAEFQMTGRGRMNRSWYSPRSSGLCMSLAYTFPGMPDKLPSLSLAIGSGIAEALLSFGVRDIGLKWPNDIVVGDAKLCGILSEVAPASGAGLTVVIGVGLNVDLGDACKTTESVNGTGRMIDLASCSDSLPSRSEIAAMLIESIFDTIRRFAADGFSPFLTAWNRSDWLRGRRIKVETATGLIAGIADGIDQDGALLLDCGGAVQHLMSGSVILDEQTSVQR